MRSQSDADALLQSKLGLASGGLPLSSAELQPTVALHDIENICRRTVLVGTATRAAVKQEPRDAGESSAGTAGRVIGTVYTVSASPASSDSDTVPASESSIRTQADEAAVQVAVKSEPVDKPRVLPVLLPFVRGVHHGDLLARMATCSQVDRADLNKFAQKSDADSDEDVFVLPDAGVPMHSKIVQLINARLLEARETLLATREVHQVIPRTKTVLNIAPYSGVNNSIPIKSLEFPLKGRPGRNPELEVDALCTVRQGDLCYLEQLAMFHVNVISTQYQAVKSLRALTKKLPQSPEKIAQQAALDLLSATNSDLREASCEILCYVIFLRRQSVIAGQVVQTRIEYKREEAIVKLTAPVVDVDTLF